MVLPRSSGGPVVRSVLRMAEATLPVGRCAFFAFGGGVALSGSRLVCMKHLTHAGLVRFKLYDELCGKRYSGGQGCSIRPEKAAIVSPGQPMLVLLALDTGDVETPAPLQSDREGN